MSKEVVAVAAGAGVGGALTYFLTRPQGIYAICLEMEKGVLTPEQFVTKIYALTPKGAPPPDSLTYWVSRYNDAGDSELNTNLFAGSSVPIVGLNSADSTRPRTLAMLIIRSQISISANPVPLSTGFRQRLSRRY